VPCQVFPQHYKVVWSISKNWVGFLHLIFAIPLQEWFPNLYSYSIRRTSETVRLLKRSSWTELNTVSETFWCAGQDKHVWIISAAIAKKNTKYCFTFPSGPTGSQTFATCGPRVQFFFLTDRRPSNRLVSDHAKPYVKTWRGGEFWTAGLSYRILQRNCYHNRYQNIFDKRGHVWGGMTRRPNGWEQVLEQRPYVWLVNVVKVLATFSIRFTYWTMFGKNNSLLISVSSNCSLHCFSIIILFYMGAKLLSRNCW